MAQVSALRQSGPADQQRRSSAPEVRPSGMAGAGRTVAVFGAFVVLGIVVLVSASGYFDDVLVGAMLSALVLAMTVPILIPARRSPDELRGTR